MTSGRRGVARGFSRHSWLAAHQLWRRHTKDKIVDCHCLMGGCCLAVAAGFAPRGSDYGPLRAGLPAAHLATRGRGHGTAGWQTA